MIKKFLNSIFRKKLKYVVIGAGSTGATFACFLQSAKKDVVLLSKYQSVINKAKEKGGIRLISEVKGDKRYKVKIKTESTFKGKADVIILCVRTPDILSTLPFIEKVSHKNTVVFSISNGFGIGFALSQRLKNVKVLDANFVGKCRWFNREDVEYLQKREYCELNFADLNSYVDTQILEQIKKDFKQAGMNTTCLTKERFNEISFERLITRSPFEACCIYYNINANQIIDEKRQTFENLCNELMQLAKAMKININHNFLKEYYDNFEKYKERDDANVYSSILNDMNIGQISEIDFLFFIVIELAKIYKVELPTYSMIAKKFKEYNTLKKYLG